MGRIFCALAQCRDKRASNHGSLPVAFSRRAAGNHKIGCARGSRSRGCRRLLSLLLKKIRCRTSPSPARIGEGPQVSKCILNNMPTPRSQKPVVGIKTKAMLKHHSALILFRTESSAVIVVVVVTVAVAAFSMKPHAEKGEDNNFLLKKQQKLDKTRLQRRHQQPPHSQRATNEKTDNDLQPLLQCTLALATRASLGLGPRVWSCAVDRKG